MVADTLVTRLVCTEVGVAMLWPLMHVHEVVRASDVCDPQIVWTFYSMSRSFSVRAVAYFPKQTRDVQRREMGGPRKRGVVD